MALHAVCGVCERDVLVLQDFLDLLCFTAGFGHTRPRRLRPRWGVDARPRREPAGELLAHTDDGAQARRRPRLKFPATSDLLYACYI